MSGFLEVSDGHVRYKILRALGRMRSVDPSLRLDPIVLRTAVERTLRAAFQLLDWRVQLLRGTGSDSDVNYETSVQGLIIDLLEHKQSLVVERLFRLLGLLHPKEDLRSIYRGLSSRRPQARASSRELLEHLLHPPVRDPLLLLVDELPDPQRLERVGEFYRPRSQGYAGILRTLLEEGGPAMRCLVAYHAGELRLVGLKPVLESLASDREGFVSQAIESAISLFEMPSPVSDEVVHE